MYKDIDERRALDARRQAKYRIDHPERVKASKAAYRATHLAQDRAWTKKWRSENKERMRESDAKHHAKNIDREKAVMVAWRTANPGRDAEWKRANKGKVCSYEARRRAARLMATPVWANLFFIEEIYDLAQRRTKATGFQWHVDHIVPLVSKRVCGLHVENNLQVIPAVQNWTKHNRSRPHMPAEMRI